jgi:hypothetical protein
MQPIKIDIDAMARCDEAGEWAAISSKYDDISDMLADGVDIDDIPESYYSFYLDYYLDDLIDDNTHRHNDDDDDDDEYNYQPKILAKTQPNRSSKNDDRVGFVEGVDFYFS